MALDKEEKNLSDIMVTQHDTLDTIVTYWTRYDTLGIIDTPDCLRCHYSLAYMLNRLHD